jgi:tRNA(His) 5'-end guanylyltransferase
MLMLEKGINFNDMPTEFKRGVCCVRREVPCADRLVGYKTDWVIDKEIPIFTQDRNYVEQWVYCEEN